jgi:hypothetical protein
VRTSSPPREGLNDDSRRTVRVGTCRQSLCTVGFRNDRGALRSLRDDWGRTVIPDLPDHITEIEVPPLRV